MLTLIKFAEKALQTGAFSANFVNSAQQSERMLLSRADKPFCSKAAGRRAVRVLENNGLQVFI